MEVTPATNGMRTKSWLADCMAWSGSTATIPAPSTNGANDVQNLGVGGKRTFIKESSGRFLKQSPMSAIIKFISLLLLLLMLLDWCWSQSIWRATSAFNHPAWWFNAQGLKAEPDMRIARWNNPEICKNISILVGGWTVVPFLGFTFMVAHWMCTSSKFSKPNENLIDPNAKCYAQQE